MTKLPPRRCNLPIRLGPSPSSLSSGNLQPFHPQVRAHIRLSALESPLFHAPQHMMDGTDDVVDNSGSGSSRTYVRNAKAMAATPADIKEYPNSYVLIFDMPGLKSGDIKVQVEDDNMLQISGERKREEEKEGAKYVRMERKVGKFMLKFVLPENANIEVRVA